MNKGKQKSIILIKTLFVLLVRSFITLNGG